MLFDDILIKIGEFGAFQKRVYFLASLCSIPWAFHAIGSVFLAAQTDHWCSVPAEFIDTFNCSELELEPVECEIAKKNYTIPHQVLNGKLVYDQCERYNITSLTGQSTASNVTTECDMGWEYDRSQYTATTVQDFNLVCGSKNLPNYADSAYFAGFLVGVFLFGNLADWIGRYLSFFIGIGAITVSGTVAAFSPSFIVFAIMRFFIGLTNVAGLSGFILVSEFVGPSKRAMAGTVMGICFGIGYILLAVIAYFIRDWRHLQLAISVPSVLFFLLIPFLCESPRWLISRGKFTEAEKIIRKVAKINKVELPEVLFVEEDKILQKDKTAVGTPWDLFKTPNMRAKTLNLFYNWFVNNMVYYGLSLSTSGLGVNDYVAALVSGAVELPAYLSSWYIMDKFGRRLPLCIYMVGGGAACLLSAFIPPGVGRTSVAMIGKFGITGSFNLIYIYSGEIYPTPVRSIGVGMSSMCARISGVIAPFILVLGNYWAPLPVILFGANSIIAGVLALRLPETLGRNLPQTLEEAEEFKNENGTYKLWSLCTHANNNTKYQHAPTTECMNDATPATDDNGAVHV